MLLHLGCPEMPNKNYRLSLEQEFMVLIKDKVYENKLHHTWIGGKSFRIWNARIYISWTERMVGLQPTIKGSLRNPAILCAIRTGSSLCKY